MLTLTDVDIVALDAAAVRESLHVVAQATAADLTQPTPCADWTLHDLLAHMVAQHHGFAAASIGDGNLSRWQPGPLGEDPIATYRAASHQVLAAFAADGVLDRVFPLPEVKSGSPFPARQAISFHFLDYVVHSWDVAEALGLSVHFESTLLDVALHVAEAVPTGAARLEPAAAFAPRIATPATSSLERILALLGRSPHSRPDAGPEQQSNGQCR